MTESNRARTTEALVALVLDPRDPGYESAARRRRETGRGPARIDRPLAAVGALVVGFVIALGWVDTHRGAPAAAKVHDALVDRVHTAQQVADALAATQGDLQDRLDRAQAQALPGDPALLRALDTDQLLAGGQAVTGPGLEVTLAEPAAGTTAPTDSATPGEGGHILLDRDVRSVVNELWADGAEAIAVNGIRLTPTSAIRFAGDAVLVDLAPITSPYVVSAIGDTATLLTRFTGSAVASRYQTLAGADGIGFSISGSDQLNLPGEPVVRLRYARAVGRR